MKQILFTFILMLSASIAIKAADNGVVASFDPDRLGTALEADGTIHHVYYEVEGDDLVFYFLNDDFSKGEKVVFAEYGLKIQSEENYIRLTDFDWNNLFLTKGIFESQNTTEWVMKLDCRIEPDFYRHRLVYQSGKVIECPYASGYGVNPSTYFGFETMKWYDRYVGTVKFSYSNPTTGAYTQTIEILDYSQGDAGVNEVVARMSQAYPNPLTAGETLTVEFESPTDSAGRFMVIDMRGRTIYSVSVEAGTAEVYVPAGLVRHGEYIYTVTDGHNLIANGKVLATKDF